MLRSLTKPYSLKHTLLTCLVFALCMRTGIVEAQNEQQIFLNGKQYYSEGQYNFAMESFQKLADPSANHAFKEYASFYYGLAAYKNGELGLARSMWLQVEAKYPDWKQLPEVFYWLSEVYFQEGNPQKGTHYAKKSGLTGSEGLIAHHLKQQSDVALLESIWREHPEDKAVAIALAEAIVKQPLSERNFDLMRMLSDKFGFDDTYFGLPDIGQSVKKQTYRVAVMLPFMHEASDTRRAERNKFVLDIYKGIKLAAAQLNQEGEYIKLYPYDTKRNKQETSRILRRPEMKSMDLIIGPLYPEPSRLTSDFCFANKINMINPISSNSVIINDNPFSFLINPTHETQALKAAQFAIDSLQNRNKNVFVFYDDTEKDSVMAHLYTQAVKEAGFEVLLNTKLDQEKINRAYDLLTKTYEDTLSRREADSIRRLPGRIVKESKPRSSKDSLYMYEERFTLEKDSIGHIYLASSKSLHASMFISALEIRGDSTAIIGRENWLENDMLTISQLERLGVYFVHPGYVDYSKPSYQQFRENYMRQYRELPETNSQLAYETMMYTGTMMKKYGSMFQKGTLQEGMVPGQLLHGIRYDLSNSNQAVPITRFYNAELQIVNSRDDKEEQ